MAGAANLSCTFRMSKSRSTAFATACCAMRTPPPACASCLATETFLPPGLLARHFTGFCPLDPRYEEPDGSFIPYGNKRKCRCFLSHFGAEAAVALVRALQAAP